MAMSAYNDARETHRNAYGAWFGVRYAIRRHIHWYIWSLLATMLAAPALWYVWLPLMGFLYTLDTDQKARMQDPFGREKGPYLKKKKGLRSGYVEEWSVISTPSHRGGDGIWPLGNNIVTDEEIWASDDYVRTHAVVSGTTGSGKTATMSSTFIYVAMIADSGVIMIDGKADPKTWFELYAMAVAAGRTDDFLVLNFVVGQTQEAEFSLSSAAEKELWEEFQAIESNTFNIFGTGTSDTLFEIGSALLGAEASGDNKMWVERAEALLRSLLKALVDLRDLGQLKVSIATLQEYMSLEKLSELEANEDISEIARQQVGAVLNEIAGYRDAMKIEDPQKRAALLADQPSKQFAFLHMQFGALYAMLIGTYGHIANVEYSDIWAPDVIRNRRILLVMLPALEKAPTSLAQLGRMATSAIKSALAQNISGSLTGRKSELVDRRPTNSTRAMVLIYDEAASYIQAGTADVASQSRSLGAFNIFSSQEWGSFKQAGEIEAQRIISNTGLKIVLKNEDKDTADQFMGAIGEAAVLKSGGKRHENGKLVESEQRLENVPRVTFQQMMNLAEGQAYIKWRDTLIHARMPFVPHPKITAAQRNDLVPMPGSMANDRVKMRLNYAEVEEVMDTHIPPVDLVQGLIRLLDKEEDKELKPQYALMEKIVRSSFSHQVVIPWKEAPPPRGKVKATEMFTFEPGALAPYLMQTMERCKDHVLIGRLLELDDKPDDRFAMPFMPHEAGMIAGGHEQDAEVLKAKEGIDKTTDTTEHINALLDKASSEQHEDEAQTVDKENVDAEEAPTDAPDSENAADEDSGDDDFEAEDAQGDDDFTDIVDDDDEAHPATDGPGVSLTKDTPASAGGFSNFLSTASGEEELSDDQDETYEAEEGYDTDQREARPEEHDDTEPDATVEESSHDGTADASDDALLAALGNSGLTVQDLTDQIKNAPPKHTDDEDTVEGMAALLGNAYEDDDEDATQSDSSDSETPELEVMDDDLPFSAIEPEPPFESDPDADTSNSIDPEPPRDMTHVKSVLSRRHQGLMVQPRQPFDINDVNEEDSED